MKRSGKFFLALLLLIFCLTVSSTNLLVNPTFEEKEPTGQLKGWIFSYRRILAGPDDFVHEGTGAGKIVKIKDGISHVAALTQWVPAQPNTTYTLSGYASPKWPSNFICL